MSKYQKAFGQNPKEFGQNLEDFCKFFRDFDQNPRDPSLNIKILVEISNIFHILKYVLQNLEDFG